VRSQEQLGSSAPDVIGPIVAWRYWRLSPDGSRLRSLTGRGAEWVPGRPFRARCRFGDHDPGDTRFQLISGYTRRAHRPPHEGCTCGIYAARDLSHLRGQMLFGFGSVMVGEVALWGKVIPGQHGYRAQLAYPRTLFLMQRGAERAEAILERLAAYNVPVEVIPRQEASFHPGLLVSNALGRVGASLRASFS
jgi:hypothetical protein